ncbi:7 transmembrane receptor (Secretin family) [Popillia japonica]|uniref:7 transmembrane receptor (Secretin family) n=1 Tax=Popillia japonica TaxID=7064 RepID=A0AAW1N302_POPJA
MPLEIALNLVIGSYMKNIKLVVSFNETNFTLPDFYIPLVKGISRTGYTFSLFALVIAFIIMFSIKKLHCSKNKLHMHLFASFILKIVFEYNHDFLFVEGVGLRSNIRHKNGDKYFFVDKDSNNWTCKFVISLWEFFIIANYSWILMEGLYLYNLIFSALFADSSRNIIHYIVLGWGLPILVIIPWIITRLIFDDTLCWTTHKEKMIFLIIRIPIMISILINFFLFIRITIVIYSKLQAPIYEEARRYQKWAKSTLVLVPLFGIHYALLMGMSYFINQNSVIEAIWLLCDQLFASFQGFFVALLYCFLNAEVRSELKPHVHSFLTAWAMNDVFKYIFPCRTKYLNRSGRGRPSVCTTMSCSSLFNNGINTHRNSKIRLDTSRNKLSITPDRHTQHICRPNVRSWHEASVRWSTDRLPGSLSKNMQVNYYSNGNLPNEKSPCLDIKREANQAENHNLHETSFMLPHQ